MYFHYGTGIDIHKRMIIWSIKQALNFIAGVGPNNFTDISATNVYQDRVAIDGLNLFEFKYKLKPFFNPENVYSKQDRQFFKGNRDYEE